jgi:TolB-like protein
MRTVLLTLALVAATACGARVATALAAPAAAPPPPAAPAPAAPAEEAVIIIFPFASPDGGAAAGASFTDSLNLRARRLGLVVVDPLSFKDAMAGAAPVTLETPPAEVVKILKERFSARYGLWGSVRPEGAGLAMDVRGVDAQAGERPVISGTYRAAEKQLVNPVQDGLLLELTGRKKKPVAEASPEEDAKVPTTGAELVKNGGFETGAKSPDNWQRIDGLTTFWPAEGRAGKGLKIVTDVYHDQWVEWQKQYKAGASADKAPAAAQTSGNKYDTVAGIYGVAYDSDPIPVAPGKSYKVSISYKGKSDDFFFPKLFIRGWARVGDEDRVVYDAYLALRCATGGKEWESNVRIIDVPKDTQSPVKYVKLKIYAYWPPGTFYFDDVSMKECQPRPAKK